MRYTLPLMVVTLLCLTLLAPSQARAIHPESELGLVDAQDDVVPPVPAPDETSLSLPTINVYSSITTFPVVGESWQINRWEQAVGHFDRTAWVQDTGNIVLGGHSTYPDGSHGVFYRLGNIHIGDAIYLTVDGQQRRYVVTEKHRVDYRDLDPVRPTDDNRLTLITCDVDSTSERLVVVAMLS